MRLVASTRRCVGPFSRHANHLYRRLLEILALDLVPLRPGRFEPRAVKRRPKPFQRLMKPRHRYREVPHGARGVQKKTRPQTPLILAAIQVEIKQCAGFKTECRAGNI